jgi:integrase
MANELTTTATITTDLAHANLARYAKDAQGAFAPNTVRALRADTAVFTAWCDTAGVPALPAASQTVADFIDAMRAASKRPATIRRYVSSIAHLHRAAELPVPSDSNTVKLALRRMMKEDGAAQQQADGLTRRLVDRALHAGGSRLRDLRNRALLAVAYDTLCRRSELVALRREDLQAGPHGDGTLLVRRGKTDQEGAGMVRFLAPDTMKLLHGWIEAAGITEGALFRSVRKGDRVGDALDPGDVARLFKAMVRTAGLTPEQVVGISGHSSRVGAAQDMAASDRIEMPAIMQAGGWKSPQMVARYTQRQAARRSGAAKLAELQNRV